MAAKKKFGETKVGKFLKEKAPSLAGDILNISGDILGIEALKNLGNVIDGSPELTPEERHLANQALIADIEAETERQRIETQDRDSARNREIELAKAGKTDTVMLALAAAQILVFLATVGTILWGDVKNEKLSYMIVGESLTMFGVMIQYYWGSSRGSKEKAKQLELLKN